VGTPILRLLALFYLVATGALALPAQAAETSLPTTEAALSRAAGLINENRADEAYTLLYPLEEQLAGQRQYDYLLGLAELDSGRPELATIALERVLVVDPQFAGARMALARAYFAMGAYTAAETAFLQLLEYNPPPQVRIVVDRYLAAIKQRAEARRTQVRGYISTRIGRDTNANNATGVSTFQVPALNNLTVTLAPNNQKSASYYGELALGISAEHQISEGLGLYAGLDANHRDLPRGHPFDQSGINGTFGVILGSAPDTVRIGGLAGQSFLAGTKLYHNLGVNASWQHVSGRRDLWTLFGQVSSIRYNNAALFNNNVDSILAGISETHAMGDSGKILISASLYGGYERDAHHRADGAKSLLGGNLGAQAKLTRQVSMYGSFGAQLGDYKRQNVAFLKTRYDRVYSASVGLAWILLKDVTLQTAYNYTSNLSTIVINQYNRTDVSMTLRWAFNR